MKRFVVGIVAAAALVSMTRTVQAQSRTINSEMRTETAVVEAIEAASRTVTLKKPDGTIVSVVAGPDIKRFAEIKIGDKVNARYYENVIVRLKQPGERTWTPSIGDDRFGPGHGGWHSRDAADGERHDNGHRHEGAVGHFQRAEWLEVHLESVRCGGARQGEGRR